MKLFGFSRAEKVTRSKDYKRIYKEGKRFVTKFFVLFYSEEADRRTKRRLGVTVTREVGNAVVRNRIKRQAREYFRLNKDSFFGGIYIVLARRSAGRATKRELREDLKDLFKRFHE